MQLLVLNLNCCSIVIKSWSRPLKFLSIINVVINLQQLLLHVLRQINTCLSDLHHPRMQKCVTRLAMNMHSSLRK
jgi:hypothetical protein